MADAVDQRDRVVRLLRQLPPRQRTAVVLRYWEDLTEAETAEAMNCTIGTVKSATSRGLGKLRELSEAAGLFPEGDSPAGGYPAGGYPAGHPGGIGWLETSVRTSGSVA